MDALGLSQEQLRDPGIVAGLQREIQRGAAQHQLGLLRRLEKLQRGASGSVNAVLAALREKAGWERPGSQRRDPASRPDASAAVAELDGLLRKLFDRGDVKRCPTCGVRSLRTAAQDGAGS